MLTPALAASDVRTTPSTAGSTSGTPSADAGIHSVRVIVNGAAGTPARWGDQSRTDVLARVFAEYGIRATFDFVDAPQLSESATHGLDLTRRGEVDAVVVGGGDGTVQAVAAVFAGTDVPLGILPLGTLNHFARDIGLPLDLHQAVAVIAAGHTRQVDLGEVNGHIFINNSSIGIYPYMVLDRERRRARQGLAKWTAMALAFLRAIRRLPRRRIRVKVAGATAAYRTACLFVGNNEYDLQFLSLGRRQQLDAGQLHLYVARSTSKLGFLWFLVRAALGLTDRVNDLDEERTTDAEITAHASRLPVALDGEVEMLPTPLRYRARPGDLRVIVPPADQA